MYLQDCDKFADIIVPQLAAQKITHIHNVEEKYPASHPFYRHLVHLKAMLRTVASKLQAYLPAGAAPVTLTSGRHILVSKVASDSQSPDIVYNVLSTSYPSDHSDPRTGIFTGKTKSKGMLGGKWVGAGWGRGGGLKIFWMSVEVEAN